jgi:hypothetical protein
VIVGRSLIVSKPLASLLMAPGPNATVTLTHRHTVDLASHTRMADILVVAVGKPGLITAEMVKPGATVIDVGVNARAGRGRGARASSATSTSRGLRGRRRDHAGAGRRRPDDDHDAARNTLEGARALRRRGARGRGRMTWDLFTSAEPRRGGRPARNGRWRAAGGAAREARLQPAPPRVRDAASGASPR